MFEHPGTMRSLVAIGFGFFLVTPSSSLAQVPGEQPVDPYGPHAAHAAQPLDPYANVRGKPAPAPPVLPTTPPQLVAPGAPPLTPAPAVPPPLEPAYPRYPPPASIWNTPDGCAECSAAPAQPPLLSTTGPVQMERKPRYGLVAAGLAIFGGLWVTSLSTAVLNEQWALAIPVAGPFMFASDLNHHYGGAGVHFATILLAVDGIAQTAGLLMAIVGGATKHNVVKRRPYGPPPPLFTPYGAGVAVRF